MTLGITLVRILGFIRYLFGDKKVPKKDTKTVVFDNFLAVFGTFLIKKVPKKVPLTLLYVRGTF